MASVSTPKTTFRVDPAPQRRKIVGVRIAGTGSYVPENVVRNEDLSSLGCDPDWIIQRTGIKERCHVLPGQATSDLAYEAAVRCLADAEMDISEIDLIICGTMTPDHATPNTACLVQDRLGASCGAFDLSAACSGFMYAFITGAQFVKSGSARNVLVIGADIMSQVSNPDDKRTYPLFGDAAGAVVISAAGVGSGSHSRQGILSYALGSDGGQGQLLTIPASGSREPVTIAGVRNGRHLVHMDGRPVFKWAVRKISDSVRQVLAEAKLTTEDIDLLVLHQANVRIIDSALQDLGLPAEKAFINLHKYGNTAAGSIPLALDEAARNGMIHRGDKVVLCGFGAGLSWGACVLQW